VASLLASRARSHNLAGAAGGERLMAWTTDPNLPAMDHSRRGGLPLATAADASRRYFGAAVRMDQIAADRSLHDLVVRDCAYLTPEIHLYWNSLEWDKGSYNFQPVDDLLTFASAHGMEVRGHTLIWDPCTPDWAKAEMNSRRDWDLVAGHFARVLGRYGDRIQDWNVVNEPLDTVDGDNGMRRTSFQRAFGSDYVARALKEARALAPKARLLINEYGFEYDNPTETARRETFLKLVRGLKERDVPLDGVGLQAHLDLSKGPLAERALRDFFREIAASGLDITISELDVKEWNHGLSDEDRDRLVADETSRYLDLALAETAVRGVVTWGISDKHSWLTENPGQAQKAPDGRTVLNRGLPYDASYKPKAMYDAIRGSLSNSARRGIAFRKVDPLGRTAVRST
jgi:endo-1,4-beta-xylanase